MEYLFGPEGSRTPPQVWGWDQEWVGTRLPCATLSVVLNCLFPKLGLPAPIPLCPPPHQSSSFTPTVTPPSIQPVSSPAVVSTSLAADLEGLTLTDSPLAPSVSGMGRD